MVPWPYILRNLGRRRLRTVMTIGGVALVVAIYAAMSSVAEEMVSSFRSTGGPDEVVITQAGALNVDVSNIERAALTYVQTLDGVAHLEDRPLVSPELWLGCQAVSRGAEVELNVRGVGEDARPVYTQVRLERGEWPAPGYRAAVGSALAARLGLDLGATLRFEEAEWTVDGILASDGRVYDQEIWVNLDDLAAAANRTTYTSLTIRVQDTVAGSALLEAVNENRRFPLVAQFAADYYARTGAMSMVMASTGTFIALVIALGAIFGGMNTMYAAVAHRRREIGVLRALGYGPKAVMSAFLAESLVMSVSGGLIGLLLGLALSLLPIEMPLLAQSVGGLSAGIAVRSLGLVLVIGLVGGGLPALQASRLRVVEALR